MKIDRGRQAMLALFGISAGVAGGVWMWQRRRAGEKLSDRVWGRSRGPTQDVMRALSEDPELREREIEVDAISQGVVELTGEVLDRRQVERAVGIAQRTTGVYTVVNRLTVEAEETHRNDTRRRWTEGAPDLRERHHYGMGVGMGTRRQSPATDPDRPSDKQSMLERELDVGRVDDQAAVPPRVPNTASRVESTDVKPGDEDSIQDAGLDPHGAPLPDERTDGAGGETRAPGG